MNICQLSGHGQRYAENEAKPLSKRRKIPQKGPFLQTLPVEILTELFNRLSRAEFALLTQGSKWLFKVGYEALAHNASLLSSYVGFRYDNPSTYVKLFQKRTYGTPFALSIPMLRCSASAILRRFPEFHSYTVHAAPNECTRSVSVSLSVSLPARLKKCRVFSCDVHDSDLMKLRKRCPEIQLLDVSNSCSVTKRAFTSELPWMHLTELNLSFLLLSDEDLVHILRACPNVRRLNLFGCRHITGSFLSEVRHVEFFEELTLSCTELSGEAFLKIVSQGVRLHALSIGHCKKIGSEQFLEAQYLAPLKKLVLEYCTIPNKGLRKILEIGTLESLDISNCFSLDGPFDFSRLKKVVHDGSNVSCARGRGLPAATNRSRIAKWRLCPPQ